MKMDKDNRYIRFVLYLAVVVLVNAAAATLFFRLDLTRDGVYSLSGASRDAVARLSEPLTIKVFFTGNLPAPYNTVERYLHDLLEEYAIAGNRYFNYEFYTISADDEERAREYERMARDYGIQPVQIQTIEQDEVKFRKAFMGMVLIHGDIIQTIPAVTSTEGLEYRITSAIRKMSDKISALLALEEPVKVKLILSSSLQVVGPYMNVTGLADLPERIKEIVERLNGHNYGKLRFIHLDPTVKKEDEAEAERYRVMGLRWNAFTDRQGRHIDAGRGYAGIVVEHDGKAEKLPLLEVFRLPLFGIQYQVVDLRALEKAIDGQVERLINVNREIGYLADHGTLPLSGGLPFQGRPEGEGAESFRKLVSEEYTLTPVRLKDSGIPEGISFLMIAGPKEEFTDYELYRIDQFLMKGKSLAIFLDSFQEKAPDSRGAMLFGRRPVTEPVKTGLEKLLEHYGIRVKSSYVLDENCFRQRVPRALGGGERPVYFAPIIKSEMINSEVPYLYNIKGLVMLKASPVELDEKKLEQNGIRATRLFSSSRRSWELKGRVDLNPLLLHPPRKEDEFRSMALAYVLEGSFPSYFADRPIPEKETSGKEAKEANGKEREKMPDITGEGITIKKGRPGRIFIIGTSEILRDNIIDEEGESPNAQFVMNVIDYLNGREDIAVMRTKTQRFNPLKEIPPSAKTAIKSALIAGLPALVIIAGLIVWFRRMARRRLIQQIFGG